MPNLRGITRRALLGRAGAATLGVALTGTLGACAAAPGTSESPPTPAGRVTANTSTSGALTRPTSITTVATPSGVTATGSTTADTPRRGGILRFGNVGDFGTLEGQTANALANDQLDSVWDRLIDIDANQQPQPQLAESWDIADDYQQIKFNLRRGVQFHTGRELTSDDVKWSLQRIQDPKIGSTYTGRLVPMTGVETPDKYTVIFRASRPWVEAFDVFAQARIIDPITFGAAGLSKPVGTGAFMFAEYAQGDHLRLVKNPNYWRAGFPHVDEVLVSIHADAQAAVVKLEADALDLISFGLPVADMIRLQKDSTYQVLVNYRTGSSWTAYLNCARAPTDNKLVRQALNYALDRQRMADVAWHGLSKPMALPWASTSSAYDATKNGAYAFDLDKATSLLAQAGETVHTPLEIVWPTTVPEFAALAQIYQQDLAKIGLQATLRPMEAAVYFATRNNHGYGGVLLGINSLGGLKPASQMLGVSYGPGSNLSDFRESAYTQLANQVLNQTDPAKQRVLFDQLNDYYLDQSFVLPIVQTPEHLAARLNVHGLRWDGNQAVVPAEVWLAS